MTAAEAVKRLNKIKGGEDKGEPHEEADAILLRFLRDSGSAEVADAYGRLVNRCGGSFYYA